MSDGNDYLTALRAYLAEAVKQGTMTATEADAWGNEAVRILNTGSYVPMALPFANEIFAKRQWYRQDPEWRLGEKAMATTVSPELQRFQYYTGQGLPPSQAWTQAQAAVTPDIEGLPPQLRKLMESGLSASEAMSWLKMTAPEEEAGLTEYQRRQLELAEQESQWQMRQPQGPQWRPGELALQQQQARTAEITESARLAALGDRGWIERWYAENAPRQQAQPRGFGVPQYGRRDIKGTLGWTPEQFAEGRQRVSEARTAGEVTPDIAMNLPASWRYAYGYAPSMDIARQQEAANAILRELGGTYQDGQLTPPRPELEWGPTTVSPTLFSQQVQQELARRQIAGPMPLYQDMPAGIPESGPMGPPPKGKAPKQKPQFRTPPTPEFPWLAQVTPGLGARLGDWAGKTKVPSGQLMGQIPPSEWARFGAMLGWRRGTGTEWRSEEDIFAAQERMRPRTPISSRGWAPARRRV